MLTSPCPFKPISGTRLLQYLADIRDQEFLRCVGERKGSNIFYSHHLVVEIVLAVSAINPVKVLNLRSIGCSNT